MRQKLVIIASILFLTWAAVPAAHAQWVQTNGLFKEDIQVLAGSGSNLFAGTADSGVFLSTNNGVSWSAVSSGLTNMNVYALAVNGSYLFAGTHGGGVFRSSNTGASWAAAGFGLTDTTILSLLASGTNLFAGTYGGGVFRSTDSGTSWTLAGLNGDYVDAIVASDTNLFVGAGDVFLSTNNGTTWAAVSPDLNATDVLGMIGTNLLAGSNGMPGYVFLTTNNGSSWSYVGESLSDGIGDTYITSFAVSGSSIFAACNGYVFLSTDSGANWTQASSWLGNVVYSLAVSDSILFAGTTGSGVWRRPLSDFNQSGVAENAPAGSGLRVFPNPFTQSTTITFTSQAAGYAEVSIVNMLGVEVTRLFSGEMGAGEHSFTWDAGKDACTTGIYECLIRMNGQVETLPVVLMH